MLDCYGFGGAVGVSATVYGEVYIFIVALRSNHERFHGFQMMIKPSKKNNRSRFHRARVSLRNVVRHRLHKKDYLQFDKSGYDVIFCDGIMSVRHYRALEETDIEVGGQVIPVHSKRYAAPIVMVPPLGVYSWIFDLMVHRSLVRYFLARGFDVYLIDWGSPGEKEAYLRLENYVLDWFPKAVNSVRRDSDCEELSLMGYCMGGLFALMYLAASEDQNIRNLVTIAAPIDVSKMGVTGKLSTLANVPAGLIEKYTPLRMDKLNQRLFHVPGEWLSVAFKLSNPWGSLNSYIHLLKNLDDEEYVSEYVTMNEWFTHMPDYPGGMVQDIVQKLGLHNRLGRGKVKINGTEADFSTITCNLLALAGDNDKIVSVESAYKIMSLISSREKFFHIVPGGHAGVFAGQRAVGSTWAISGDWLEKRSY